MGKELAGGAPLLLHRRRVPDESAKGAGEGWLTWRDSPPSVGPGVWACVECAGGLRTDGRTAEGGDRLPHITTHMLANDNWQRGR